MMIYVCMECGQEVKCYNCNPYCPVCGGVIKKLDYVKYKLRKAAEDGEDS